MMQLPFQRALIVARVWAASEPTYSADPTTHTFGVEEVKVSGVVPVVVSLSRTPAESLITTLSDEPLTVGADAQVFLRTTYGRFQRIVLIVEAGAQLASPACEAVMEHMLESPDNPAADVTK
jgi:hypothetical protein